MVSFGVKGEKSPLGKMRTKGTSSLLCFSSERRDVFFFFFFLPSSSSPSLVAGVVVTVFFVLFLWWWRSSKKSRNFSVPLLSLGGERWMRLVSLPYTCLFLTGVVAIFVVFFFVLPRPGTRRSGAME